jgi:hypothetical protein
MSKPDFFRYINTLIHSKRQIAMPSSAFPKVSRDMPGRGDAGA